MPNIDQLSYELGTYHYLLDLANALFSIDINTENQDWFSFTLEGQSGHLLFYLYVTCITLLFSMAL